MNVAIVSSSSLDIDNYYLSITRSISGYLARQGFDLLFGGASKSMMGICYQEFKRNKRNIFAYTTSKYADDLNNLDTPYKTICETTFDLKKQLYNAADIIIALPGGLGTLSEFLSFVEEARSNDNVKPIIVYDDDGSLNEMISNTIKKGFNSIDICSYFTIVRNKEEFTNQVDNFLINERKRLK